MQALYTERLVIRNFRPDDWRDLHEMIALYAASEYAQYDHQWPTSPEEIQGVAVWFAQGDSFLAVCLKATDKVIGFLALTREESDDGPEHHLGYVFNTNYHCQGYATEACRAAIDHVFGELGTARIVVGTAAANQPSRRLLGRLGLHETGRGRVSFQHAPDGTPTTFESVSFALSREEWGGSATA